MYECWWNLWLLNSDGLEKAEYVLYLGSDGPGMCCL